MQAHAVNTSCKVCLVGINLTVLVLELHAVVLSDKVVPQLFPIPHGEVFRVFLCRADFYADYILAFRGTSFHHVPHTLRVKPARERLSLTW